MSMMHKFRSRAFAAVCARPWLSSLLRARVVDAFHSQRAFSPLVHLVRAHVYPLFCAGSTFHDCRLAARLWAGKGVLVIPDHSMEEEDSTSGHEANKQVKTYLPETQHIPIKITSLVPPSLLEAVTMAITAHPEYPHLIHDNVFESLPPALAQQWHTSITHLSEIAQTASSLGLSLLLDAEQSHRQPAIDLISRTLSIRFNTTALPPTIYNTYQMYLKDSLSRLERDLEFAASNQCAVGVKLVRGAYLVRNTRDRKGEAELAEKFGTVTATHSSKAQTDLAYTTAVERLVQRIARGEMVGVLFATHNRESVLHAMQLLHQSRVASSHNVHFAQIMGICDPLTCDIANAGGSVSKLVVFGEFDFLFPWLMRRVDENEEMLLNNSQDKPGQLPKVQHDGRSIVAARVA